MGGKPLNGSGEEWVGGLGRFAWERKKEGRIKEGGDFANRSNLNLTKCQKLQTKKHVPKGTKKTCPKEPKRTKITLRGANNILEHHNVGTGCAEDGEDDDDCT